MQDQANAYKVTMIFPKKDPDGKKISASVLNAMTNELREKVAEWKSGFTEIPVRGEWRSAKDDNNSMYFLTVSTLDQVEQLWSFVRKWRKPFQQETMCFDYHPIHFELVGD